MVTMMVMVKSEVAAARSRRLTRLGMLAASAGAKSWPTPAKTKVIT